MTLQENNHIVIVDLPSRKVVNALPGRGGHAHTASMLTDDCVISR